MEEERTNTSDSNSNTQRPHTDIYSEEYPSRFGYETRRVLENYSLVVVDDYGHVYCTNLTYCSIMWSAILQWLSENYPMIFGALVVIGITAVFTWRVFCWVHRIKNLEKELPNKADKNTLPCEINQKKIDDYNNLAEQIRNDINEIRSDITEVRTYLLTKNSSAAPIFSRKHSPRQLNELGRKVYKDINGEDFLEENKHLFISSIEKSRPMTALDVEANALSVMIENTNKPIFNGIKKWVYNSPSIQIPTNAEGETKEYTITLNDICFILSIPLRDMYLGVHKEITE